MIDKWAIAIPIKTIFDSALLNESIKEKIASEIIFIGDIINCTSDGLFFRQLEVYYSEYG